MYRVYHYLFTHTVHVSAHLTGDTTEGPAGGRPARASHRPGEDVPLAALLRLRPRSVVHGTGDGGGKGTTQFQRGRGRALAGIPKVV